MSTRETPEFPVDRAGLIANTSGRTQAASIFRVYRILSECIDRIGRMQRALTLANIA